MLLGYESGSLSYTSSPFRMRGLLSDRSTCTGPHRTSGHRWKRPPVGTSTHQDSDMQRNCMSTCEYIRCDRWYLLNISNRVSNAGFFYRIFYPLGGFGRYYLVSKSLTSLCLLTTVLWHHSTYCTTVRTTLSHLHELYNVRTINTVHCTHCTCFPVSQFPIFDRCWSFILLNFTHVHTLLSIHKCTFT